MYCPSHLDGGMVGSLNSYPSNEHQTHKSVWYLRILLEYSVGSGSLGTLPCATISDIFKWTFKWSFQIRVGNTVSINTFFRTLLPPGWRRGYTRNPCLPSTFIAKIIPWMKYYSIRVTWIHPPCSYFPIDKVINIRLLVIQSHVVWTLWSTFCIWHFVMHFDDKKHAKCKHRPVTVWGCDINTQAKATQNTKKLDSNGDLGHL